MFLEKALASRGSILVEYTYDTDSEFLFIDLTRTDTAEEDLHDFVQALQNAMDE